MCRLKSGVVRSAFRPFCSRNAMLCRVSVVPTRGHCDGCLGSGTVFLTEPGDLKLDASLDQPAGATLLMAVAIGKNKLNRSSRFRRGSRSRFAEVLGIWKAVAARMRSSGTLGQN